MHLKMLLMSNLFFMPLGFTLRPDKGIYNAENLMYYELFFIHLKDIISES